MKSILAGRSTELHDVLSMTLELSTALHANYPVLPDLMRAHGLVRPLRTAYRHMICGLTTAMAHPIAETFACDPTFYTHTFCTHCLRHLPVAEFHWSHSDVPVGS